MIDSVVNNRKAIEVVILVFGLLFFSQSLSVHGIEYRDDEIFYFNATKEMRQNHEYFSPTYFGKDRFAKPILYYWFILWSYSLLGVSWTAARITSVIAAALILVLTWLIARDHFGKRVAFTSVVILATCPMFFRHAKNAVPDMSLNLFVVLAVYAVIRFLRNPNEKQWRYVFFVSCALGFMIKGFAAIIIPFLVSILLGFLMRKKYCLKQMNFPLGIAICLIIILPWFLYMAHRHGQEYLTYMIQTETLERTVSQSTQNSLITFGKTIIRNFLFYFQSLMSYFAPWSIFIFGAVIVAVRDRDRDERHHSGFLIMLVWFFSVLGFFALISHRINHLILILTTPFAILISYFLFRNFDGISPKEKALSVYRTGFSVFVLLAGIIGLLFAKLFLLEAHKIWLVIFLSIIVLFVVALFRFKRISVLPLSLGAMMIFSFSQTTLLSEAGLTSHSVLQKFARSIKNQKEESCRIAVLSHQIHEKELQAYFETPVEKIAVTDNELSHQKISGWMKTPQIKYLVITRDDWQKLDQENLTDVRVIKRDKIVRRHVRIDQEFFKNLLSLNQEAIKDYFFESILLIKKE